jgi:Transcriptional regulatory protein, C terminal
MMFESNNRRRYLYGSLLLALIALICVQFSMASAGDFARSRREVLLRRIGHEILLQSGDSTSRVLPVKQVAEHAYQIGFERDFTFQPASLLATTQRLLANDPSAGDYVVNVLNCTDSSVAYGFAISSHQKNDIIACIGREQPVGCYLIDIRFQPEADSTAKYGYLLVSVCLFGLLGLVLLRPIKTRKAQFQSHKTEPHQPMHRQTELFTLGSIVFDVEARKLISNGVQTDLTKTETRVLRIFAQSPNETIERSQIQKEIWEDDGVVVGRSLDMFISKLRKKLEPDPCIKIAVVRGKGYRFEVD